MPGLRERTRQRTSLQLSTSSVIEPREAERVTGARGPIAVANRLLTPDGVAILGVRPSGGSRFGNDPKEDGVEGVPLVWKNSWRR